MGIFFPSMITEYIPSFNFSGGMKTLTTLFLSSVPSPSTSHLENELGSVIPFSNAFPFRIFPSGPYTFISNSFTRCSGLYGLEGASVQTRDTFIGLSGSSHSIL